MSAFHINVTTGTGTPIYRQIIDQVRLAMATGALVPGQAMPSVRSLAERLVVNANTVVKAYAELVRDGVLESQQGTGFFVAEKRQIVKLRRSCFGPSRRASLPSPRIKAGDSLPGSHRRLATSGFRGRD